MHVDLLWTSWLSGHPTNARPASVALKITPRGPPSRSPSLTAARALGLPLPPPQPRDAETNLILKTVMYKGKRS